MKPQDLENLTRLLADYEAVAPVAVWRRRLAASVRLLLGTLRADSPQPGGGAVAKFVAIDKAVYKGQSKIAITWSANMAQRIANALNRYTPNDRGQ